MGLYIQFCVLHFLSKIQKLNMTPIFGEENFFLKIGESISSTTLWVENFNKIAPSHPVQQIQAVLCFTC